VQNMAAALALPGPGGLGACRARHAGVEPLNAACSARRLERKVLRQVGSGIGCRSFRRSQPRAMR
jgi:hypothetical protein